MQPAYRGDLVRQDVLVLLEQLRLLLTEQERRPDPRLRVARTDEFLEKLDEILEVVVVVSIERAGWSAMSHKGKQVVEPD